MVCRMVRRWPQDQERTVVAERRQDAELENETKMCGKV